MGSGSALAGRSELAKRQARRGGGLVLATLRPRIYEDKAMTTITAGMVKQLRDMTGAGMMDCKNALGETNGDVEAAVDWLRKKGLSKAAKKADRVAAEGLIGVACDGKVGALVEVNSETDFVARNPQFQEMVRKIADLAPKAGGDLAKLLAATYPGTKLTVEAQLKEAIATIGENMSVRRTTAIKVKDGVVASYMHNQAAPGLGKIGVIVALGSKADAKKLGELGRQLCMHISFANPQAITADGLDPALVEREKKVYVEQAIASGKSEEIAKKMVEGRLRKEFFQQVVLMEQTFMGPGSDGKAKVADAIKAAEKELASPIAVEAFVRYALGEGIDKKGDDFASEVSKLVKGG
jgi:elongation factor Ts